MPKMTAAEIVYTALVWGEESMVQMVAGCHESDPYRTEVAEQLKQLRAYRKRRFGTPPDPFEGAKPMSLEEIRESQRKGAAT
jgi:hypothetical protein